MADKPPDPSGASLVEPGEDLATSPLTAAEETTGKAVLHAGAWATASRFLPQIYSLLISIVAARVLGPADMGRQSLIAFAAIFGTAAATLGVPTAVMRFVGERVGAGEADTVRPLVRTVWGVEGVAAAIAASVLIAIGLNGGEPKAAWILVGLTCAFGVLQKVPTSVLIGLQRWREASAVTMVMGGVAMVLTIAVLAAGAGVTGMIAVGTATTLVILIWTTWRMRTRLLELHARPQRSSELHRRVWRYAAIASLGTPLTLIVWFRSEFFFLAHYSTDEQIAFYSIAFSAYTMLAIFPQSLANAIAPAFATLFGADASERIRAGFGRSIRLLLTATLPLTAAAAALGPETLRVVYGDAYSDTKTPLLIMLALLPVVPLLHVSMSLLVGLARQWLPLAVGTVAAAVNIGLDVLLIPDHAAVGAACANVAAQVTASVPMIVYAVRTVGGIRWEWAALLRAFFVALGSGLAAAGVLAVVDGATGVVVGVAAWAVALLILGRMLPILSPQDAGWLDGVLGDRLGPIARRVVRSPRPRLETHG
jgi:O-antigen/teichoic acid export membrane protein